MTRATIGFLIIGAWVLAGLAVALVMRRRGHDLPVWIALGGLFGPLAVPLARGPWAGADRGPVRTTGRRHDGAMTFLVGVDGSDSAIAAARHAQALAERAGGDVVLAAVVNFESTEPVDVDRAQGTLDDVARAIDDPTVERCVLVGEPAAALVHHATAEGCDVIVVGRRGHGLSKRMLGSTAEHLVHRSPVPVVVATTATPAPGPATRDDRTTTTASH